MCASSLKGVVGSLPTLSVPCALRCGGLFRVSLPLAGVVLGGWTAELSLGVRATARHPARPGNSPQLWAWLEGTLNKCLLSETEQPTGRLARAFRGLTAALQGPGERSLRGRSLREVRTGLPGAGPCPGCSCLEVCGAWGSLSAARSRHHCRGEPSLTAGESPRFLPGPAWQRRVRPCLGSSFLSVIVFLVQRGQRNVLGPAYRRHIFAHLRPAGLHLNSLLYWC